MDVPPGRVAPSPALAAALLSGVALVLGAAPTITDRDAGELATAAFHLDVAHPTGFPLDLVLLRLAALAPVGDVAFRMNLGVAALGVAASSLVAALAWRLADGAPRAARWCVALAPVCLLAGSSTVVRAWTAVEVYASALALALASLGALALGDAPDAARRRLAAVLAGVAVLSTHTSARPAAALALALLVARDARGLSARGWARRLAPVAALGAASCALVAWLPVASRRDGPVDWGDPETLRGVAAHLSAASIRASFAGRMFVAWRVPEDVGRAGVILWEDLGPALLLAALGAAFAARDRLARVLAVVGAVDLAYAVAVNPMGMSDRQTFFHAEACLALLAAVPCAWVARSLAASRPALTLALPLALAGLCLGRRDPSWVGVADGWSAPEMLGGAGALGSLPPRALVLCGSDDLCGGALYAQHVEGERPDVTVLPRQHLAHAWTWRRVDPARLGVRVDGGAARSASALTTLRVNRLLEAVGDRARWEGTLEGEDRALRERWTLASAETPVLAAVGAPAGDGDRAAASWVRARLPASMGAGARWVGATTLFAAGSRVARDDMMGAVPLWQAALAVDPDHVSSWTNLGVAAARAGDLPRAIACTRAGLAIDPERPTAWRNLRDFLRVAGDREGAAEAEREYLRRR